MKEENSHSEDSGAGGSSASTLSAIPRYLSAVLSQGLVSGFHFVLNLTLVKLLAVADFGIFALTFVLAIMASSISNALASTPLCVFGPAANNETQRREIESVLSSVMLYLLGAVLCAGLLLSTYGQFSSVSPAVLFSAIAFVLSYLARQYTRSFGYARFDVLSVLYADMVYVVSGAAMIIFYMAYGNALGVVNVLSILAIANTISVLFEVTRLDTRVSLKSFSATLVAYQDIWYKARWALAGAVTTVVVSQAHSIVVSTLQGPAAYAPLAAGFVIFGPVRVIFTTIQNVIKPEMSFAIASGNAAGAAQQSALASLISLLAVAALVAITWLAWPLLDAWLYADKYADAPMKTIVFLWAGITLISALQNGPFAALQSLKEFKPLALTTVYGSVMSLFLVTVALSLYPVHFSIVGIMITELFVAIWVIKLTTQSFAAQDRHIVPVGQA